MLDTEIRILNLFQDIARDSSLDAERKGCVQRSLKRFNETLHMEIRSLNLTQNAIRDSDIELQIILQQMCNRINEMRQICDYIDKTFEFEQKRNAALKLLNYKGSGRDG